MFKLINKYIKNNAYELLLTFFLFSNLYPYTFPSWFYLISIAMIAMKMLKYKVNVVGKWQIVGVFWGQSGSLHLLIWRLIYVLCFLLP